MSKDMFDEMLRDRRGYDVFEQKEKDYEERQKNRVFRFWLKPETGTKIVFLDDDPIILEEHQMKLDGDWKNWFTCLRVLGQECPLCQLKDNPATTGYYTIIDTTEWKDAKGETHRNEVKLFAPKFKALQILKRLSGKRGGLTGCVFEVFRTSKDAVNTGDVFDFEGKLTADQIKELNPEAEVLNYAEILKPKSIGELRAILGKNSEKANSALHGQLDDPEKLDY